MQMLSFVSVDFFFVLPSFVSLQVVKVVIFVFKVDMSEPNEFMKQSYVRYCSNHSWQFLKDSAV